MDRSLYLKRFVDKDLLDWKNEEGRKPLLLRGVRQCGKTSSVRRLGESFRYFAEVNFERQSGAKRIFSGDMDIRKISAELEELTGVPIIDGETLLFMDELQEAPDAIKALRYFYEDRQNLHVIGAGSLLEFALTNLASFGVGRITSMYMKPLSFTEFLSATGEDILLRSLLAASPDAPLSETAHSKLLGLYKVFIIVGGMPQAVSSYAQSGSMLRARTVQTDIMSTLFDDFGKYSSSLEPEILRLILRFLLGRISQQISYSNNNIENITTNTFRKGLEILANAGLIIPVFASTCSTLPIGSSVNLRRMKPLFADTGLFLSTTGLDVSEFTLETDFDKLNIGGVAELSVGLELLKSVPGRTPAELYYWTRASEGTNRGTAEVDYVIQRGSSIIPVEVKARTQGGMKSLWSFLEKGVSPYGIRLSLENFGETFRGEDRVLIYPLYAACRL